MQTPSPIAVSRGDYRLEVRDFGPIARADVELRPLTVLVGPSNTGKSYLAMLIYALHQSIMRPGFRAHEVRRHATDVRFPDYSKGEFRWPISDIKDELRNWASAHLMRVPAGSLSPVALERIRSAVEDYEWLDDLFKAEIRRCFAVTEWSSLARRGGSNPAQIRLSVPAIADPPGTAEYDFRLAPRTNRQSGRIPEILPDVVNEIADNAHRSVLEVNRIVPPGAGLDHLFDFLVTHVFQATFGTLYRSSYYLPASRTGVMQSHRLLLRSLVQGATISDPPTPNGRILLGVVADFLDHLIRIPQQGARADSTARHAEKLENHVLGGKIRIREEALLHPVFTYRPDNWQQDAPLMRASSMVTELAPVVLYLRHLVGRQDVLVIEEPEAHLHPAVQAVLMKSIADLVRYGVRIVMTTHSEWILEQLGNLVGLSRVAQKSRLGLPDTDSVLEPHEVGAWLFEPKQRPRGTVVSEISLDDSGTYRAGFEETAAALHNTWADISSRMDESE